MCGIAGTWGASNVDRVMRMADCIAHRGPDDSGNQTLGSESAPVIFAHRRLSIIDLSPAGHQPMCNEDQRIWVTYNGEIYNFKDIRKELVEKGHVFRSQSDTEILVHAYEQWGMDFVHRLNGIFAFALWDANSKDLYLCRDRLGIKPLYFHHRAGAFSFASEIKALLLDPDVSDELDAHAIISCATYRYCPEPMTLFAGVRKLPPGTWMRLSSDGAISQHKYHSLEFRPNDGADREQTIELLRDELAAATRRQMISDVPVGLFLSGGLDSSGLVALARQFTDERLKTFSIGFRAQDTRTEGQPDDLAYARIVANRFSTDHQEIIIDPEIIELLPKVVYHLDEPIADPAAITSYLICEQAKQKGAKVLLSGQGADEVFSGYPWHLGGRLAEDYARLPGWMRNAAARLVGYLPAHGSRFMSGTARRLRKFTSNAADGLEASMLGFLSYASDAVLEEVFANRYGDALAAGEQHSAHRACLEASRGMNSVNRMLHLDLQTFLPSLNLAYTDKTSMAHGVEVRVPYLDNEVVDFAARLPPEFKLKGLKRKWILKQALAPLLPAEVVTRKKAGFGAPIRTWIAKDLREMIGDLLAFDRVKRRGIFDPDGVQRIVARHQSGKDDFAYLIYFMLSFELWCERFIDARRRQASS